MLRLYIYLYIYLIYFLTHTSRILRNTNSKNVILLRRRILFLNLSQGYEKKFDRLRKDSYTSFVYETIQLFSSMSVGIFNGREGNCFGRAILYVLSPTTTKVSMAKICD